MGLCSARGHSPKQFCACYRFQPISPSAQTKNQLDLAVLHGQSPAELVERFSPTLDACIKCRYSWGRRAYLINPRTQSSARLTAIWSIISVSADRKIANSGFSSAIPSQQRGKYERLLCAVHLHARRRRYGKHMSRQRPTRE